MKKLFLSFIALIAIIKIEAQTDLTPQQKFSYAFGMSIADYIKTQNLVPDVDIKIFETAYLAVINNQQTLVNKNDVNAIIQSYFETKTKSLAAENLAKGNSFLAENKTKKGIITTSTGLQYEVLKKAIDPKAAKPTINDEVSVKYTGKKLDGTVFDSTETNNNGEAINFPLLNLIKGWQEGIPLMQVGSIYRFYIPAELGYGEAAPPQIGPNQVLIFDIELVGVTNKLNQKAP